MHRNFVVILRYLTLASLLLASSSCTRQLVFPKPKSPGQAVTTVTYTAVPDGQRRFPDYTHVDARILR